MLPAMAMETTGRLHAIFDTTQVSARFTKREFVVELADNPKYPQRVLFQLSGDRCSQLDDFKVGDDVRVEFSLRGREWQSPKGETKFFNSLDVWRVDRAGAHAGASGGSGRGRGGETGGHGGGQGGFDRDVPPPRDDDYRQPSGGFDAADDIPF